MILTVEEIKKFNSNLFQLVGNHVMAGPFAGMYVDQDVAWTDDNIGTMLLGCYENDLHPFLYKAIKRNPKNIVNLGCAEGYYAIGLARALPMASVRAIDCEPAALKLCKEKADKNGVGDRVLTCKSFFPEETDLMVADCEGCEIDLFTSDMILQMKKSDFIIECHDFMVKGVTEEFKKNISNFDEEEYIKYGISYTLIYRFNPTHDVEVVWYNKTNDLEFRAERSCWLVCWSKER